MTTSLLGKTSESREGFISIHTYGKKNSVQKEKKKDDFSSLGGQLQLSSPSCILDSQGLLGSIDVAQKEQCSLYVGDGLFAFYYLFLRKGSTLTIFMLLGGGRPNTVNFSKLFFAELRKWHRNPLTQEKHAKLRKQHSLWN